MGTGKLGYLGTDGRITLTPMLENMLQKCELDSAGSGCQYQYENISSLSIILWLSGSKDITPDGSGLIMKCTSKAEQWVQKYTSG
jgi:hypothetical protein